MLFHTISVQVYPDGIRHIRADKRVNEWKTPGKKTIVRCAVNQRQVVIALTGGELVYFEMDPVRNKSICVCIWIYNHQHRHYPICSFLYHLNRCVWGKKVLYVFVSASLFSARCRFCSSMTEGKRQVMEKLQSNTVVLFSLVYLSLVRPAKWIHRAEGDVCRCGLYESCKCSTWWAALSFPGCGTGWQHCPNYLPGPLGMNKNKY